MFNALFIQLKNAAHIHNNLKTITVFNEKAIYHMQRALSSEIAI